MFPPWSRKTAVFDDLLRVITCWPLANGLKKSQISTYMFRVSLSATELILGYNSSTSWLTFPWNVCHNMLSYFPFSRVPKDLPLFRYWGTQILPLAIRRRKMIVTRRVLLPPFYPLNFGNLSIQITAGSLKPSGWYYSHGITASSLSIIVAYANHSSVTHIVTIWIVRGVNSLST